MAKDKNVTGEEILAICSAYMSATLAGLVLVTLARFFGIKKHEKN